VHKVKLTLGVLMIGALFVPLSECTHGGKAPATPPPPKTLVQKIFPRSDARTDYDYGAARLGPSLNGVLTLIAFGWPLGLALLGRRVAGKRRAWILYTLELLLCAGTIYWIHAVTEYATRLWGAYLVFSLTIAYAIAALIDLWTSLRRGGPRSRPS
jgi:hypothetical protein